LRDMPIARDKPVFAEFDSAEFGSNSGLATNTELPTSTVSNMSSATTLFFTYQTNHKEAANDIDNDSIADQAFKVNPTTTYTCRELENNRPRLR